MRYQGKHSAGVKKRRGFRAQLAKELGVETVPESFRQAMEKTYQELPLDMPVAYRPVRTFLRRTASAAAACGLLFLALLGVNTTYPQLTEALPGLGMVFQAINSRNQEPLDDRSHLMLEAEATPTPVPPACLPPDYCAPQRGAHWRSDYRGRLERRPLPLAGNEPGSGGRVLEGDAGRYGV